MTDIAEAQLILQKEARRVALDAIERGLDRICLYAITDDNRELPSQYVKLNPDMTWHWVDK